MLVILVIFAVYKNMLFFIDESHGGYNDAIYLFFSHGWGKYTYLYYSTALRDVASISNILVACLIFLAYRRNLISIKQKNIRILYHSFFFPVFIGLVGLGSFCLIVVPFFIVLLSCLMRPLEFLKCKTGAII